MHESEFLGERGKLYATHDFQLVEDKKGLWTGTQVWYCHREDFGLVKPALRSEHPVFGWITLDSLSVSGEEGMILKLEGTYAGATEENASADEGGDDNYESGTRLTTVDSPLSTHSVYDPISADDRAEAYKLATNPSKNQDGTLKLVDVNAWPLGKIVLYNHAKKGFTHFKDPVGEYYIRYVAYTMPTDMNLVGKINVPKGAPLFDDGRNYLLAGYNITQKGRVFDIEKVWLQSGDGGWDTFHYAP
jgi:hypothetical protein